MSAEYVEFVNGRLPVHHAQSCVGPCPIHNPSEHHMRDWPMVRRMSGLVERLCPAHGVGHPDPDSVAWLNANGPEGNRGSYGVHGCCGWPITCCREPHPMEPHPLVED